MQIIVPENDLRPRAFGAGIAGELSGVAQRRVRAVLKANLQRATRNLERGDVGPVTLRQRGAGIEEVACPGDDLGAEPPLRPISSAPPATLSEVTSAQFPFASGALASRKSRAQAMTLAPRFGL